MKILIINPKEKPEYKVEIDISNYQHKSFNYFIKKFPKFKKIICCIDCGSKKVTHKRLLSFGIITLHCKKCSKKIMREVQKNYPELNIEV